MESAVRLEDLVKRVVELHPDDGDALRHLSHAVVMSEQVGEVADQLIGHFVAAARNAGATWADIGRSMGVTRQAAQKRFVPRSADPAPASDDRFTPRALAAIAAGEDEARTAGHNYVGTEHLVLGLLSQPAGLAAKALAENTTPEQLRAAMSEVLGPRCDDLPERLPYTPRAVRAIELSGEQARRLGHDFVGTEHVLLGVLAEKFGVGAKVLLELGIDQRGVEEWLAVQ